MTSLKNTWKELRKFTKKEGMGRKGECDETRVPVCIGNQSLIELPSSYKYAWKLEEAQKNIMRTHTTAVSARMLYSIAQNGFKPAKLFSVDRVFRNETLDATHLAEFHQIEGVVADRNISLGHLIGILYEFFSKLGELGNPPVVCIICVGPLTVMTQWRIVVDQLV